MSARHVRTRRRYATSGAGRPDDAWLDWACVYVIVTRDERTSHSEVGYVGQSAGVHRRDVPTGLPLARLAEHREKQWWADLIIHPYIYIVWESHGCTQKQLDVMEAWYIENGAPHPAGGSMRPRYNVEHNRDNPNIIWPSEAKERATARGFRPLKPSARAARSSGGPTRSTVRGGNDPSPMMISVTMIFLALLMIGIYVSAMSKLS